MDRPINFTVSEQNCLAEVCCMMSSVYNAARKDEASFPKIEDTLCSIYDKFPNTNWGELYDKFHRQGKNR